MSSDNTYAGPSCPCGEGCCHWSFHEEDVDLWCSGTAGPAGYCERHTPPPPPVEGTQP